MIIGTIDSIVKSYAQTNKTHVFWDCDIKGACEDSLRNYISDDLYSFR